MTIDSLPLSTDMVAALAEKDEERSELAPSSPSAEQAPQPASPSLPPNAPPGSFTPQCPPNALPVLGMGSFTPPVPTSNLQNNTPPACVDVQKKPNRQNSIFSYAVRDSAWNVGMRDCFKTTLDTLTREQMQQETDGNAGCLGRCWPRFLLCLYPVLQAFRALGFSYAWNRKQFSPISSLLLTSMLLMLLTFVAMLVAMGVASSRLLLSRRYFWYILPALLYVASLVFQYNALTLINPTVMTILMQSSSFTTALLQYLCFQRLPLLAQGASLVGINLLIVAYILGGDTSEGQGASVLGISMSLGGACLRSAFMIAMEHVSVMMQQSTADPGDRLRGMISLEFWKILLFALCLLTDWSFIEVNGLFHGWDWWTFLAAVLPTIALSAAQAGVLPSMGALRTNVAATLDIVVVYLLQITVLQIGDFHISELLLLLGIVTVVSAYNLSLVDAARAKRGAWLSMIRAVNQSQSATLTEAQSSKDRESGLRMGMRVKDRGVQFPEISPTSTAVSYEVSI